MIKQVLSKLRRVTMSLFAVLCAGAVWGEEEATPSSSLTIDPNYGYIVEGLGELGDQAAVVFTNPDAVATWKAPRDLKNVEILAVGGGGGGGGHYYNSTAKNCQGGAGGGGGAVVTGFIKNLSSESTVSVTVGAGGAGGAYTTSATTGSGKAGNGGNSIIKVDDLTYITAYGGGGDGGYNSTGVAIGGSNSGVRQNKTPVALSNLAVVGEGAEELLENVVVLRNKGGAGYSTSSGYPGSGGGGAMAAGGSAAGSSYGGGGGAGYESYITGTRTVYGSGGGGGIGKTGGNYSVAGEGAGVGKANTAGSNALANQGGGGGGGSYQKAGGAGGSGIVVLRFGYVTSPVAVDVEANVTSKISDKVYTGFALTSGLENTYAYTVEELGERINVGQQTVRVTLNEGYVWADGEENRTKEFTWSITQEPNNWKVEPYISHTTWPQVFASTVNFKFTAPETSFGVLQAELSANGTAPQAFDGVLPTEPGSYTLRYWVEETANWAAKEWVLNFTIYRSEAFSDGYKVLGLGENGDEVAVVFTQSGSWTAPANIKSAQFLVVGGGGGGGADVYDDAAAGGAGGGGGGVVVGEVDIAKNANVTITVGAGGAGGVLRTNERDGASSGTYYGASKKGGNSVLAVDGTTYVTAYGGGRDQGTTKRDTNNTSWTTSHSNIGGVGGSNGGSRGGNTTNQSEPTKGAVASVDALRNCVAYGNKGGKGCSDEYYGFPAAGGGGGATEAGGNAGNNADGWPAGKGGEGLASDITGASVVYGSGGGGASHQGSLGGKGGEGAGDGGDREGAQGTSALANQGGGGGGSSREITYGGNGGSGIVVIRYSVKAAEVDSVAYDTLAEAFAAAESGATVTLLNDATLAEKVTIKTALTLDLNGCTLSETVDDSYGAFYVGTAGSLTIADSVGGGTIATDGGIVIGNYGTVTVNGGTIEAGEVANDDTSIYNFYYNASTYGKATINGGSIGRIWNCGTANITSGTVGDIDNSGAMTIAEEAVIEDEEIILGNDAADVPNAGTIITTKTLNVSTLADDYVVEIVDGVYKLKYTKTYTVTLPAAPANTVWYCNGQEVTGPVYAEYGSDVTITLKPAEGCFFGDGAAELTVVTISGIAEDTTVSLDNVAVEAFQIVAKIGDTPYASLQAAYAAAEAESTIVLCKDVTGAGLVIDKSVTIDFGGNTYTFNDGVGNIPSNGFQILDGNTVTLKNGELNVDAGSADKFYTLIQNYANLTVEDMVLDGTNLDKWSKTDGDSYVLSNNSGTVVVAGATSIIANDEGALAYAFDVCKYKTYAIPTVTLNTTGTIDGKVEVSGGDFVIGAENTAVLSEVVFTSGSVKGNVEDALTIPEDKKLVLNEAGAYVLADKVVVAQVGDKLFEVFADAVTAAKSGDTIVLKQDVAVESMVSIPTDVTLDLNGRTIQALAVVGKLAMNGGSLKTYDTNTQTYFFMAAPAGTAALYWTSDAVMTIAQDYSLVLESGSVTLPASWRTLLGQSLTIKSGAEFVVPAGVTLNLRGNAVVEDGATLSCAGAIELGNVLDAVDTTATLKAPEGLNVVSAVEGYRVAYANGTYALEEIFAEFTAQVGETKYATLTAALAVEENLDKTIMLIDKTKEDVTIPAGFTGTIDLNGWTLLGRVDSYANGAVLKNGSIIHDKGSKAAVQIEAGSLELTDINLESNYHGVRLYGANTTAIINSGTYRLTSKAGTYNLVYATAANAKFYVYGGEFYNAGGDTYVLKATVSGSEINVYGGTFNGGIDTTFQNNGGKGIIKVFGGTFTNRNPADANSQASVQPGYKVEGTGPWTVVPAWTAPMPEQDGEAGFELEYTDAVIAALQAEAATSVSVKVNGETLKGDKAVAALNDAVACFEDALTFDGTAADLDIVITVTEVNVEDPAASTVVVKRGESNEELTVKVAPTVKYVDLGSGAVTFKLVFEAAK